MHVGRFDHAGVVDGAADERFRIVERLRIGIAVLAVILDAQVQAAFLGDLIAFQLALQDGDGKFLAALIVRFRGGAAVFERQPEQFFAECCAFHYLAPPLPPTVMLVTRITGCPTFVGTLPDCEPHMPCAIHMLGPTWSMRCRISAPLPIRIAPRTG